MQETTTRSNIKGHAARFHLIERRTFDLPARIERAKREILEDIAAGLVPATVATYSELHDYVDANYCGAEPAVDGVEAAHACMMAQREGK